MFSRLIVRAEESWQEWSHYITLTICIWHHALLKGIPRGVGHLISLWITLDKSTISRINVEPNQCLIHRDYKVLEFLGLPIGDKS